MKVRPVNKRGGVAIFVKRGMTLQITLADPRDLNATDYLGINVSSLKGSIEYVAVYSPADTERDTRSSQELIGPMNNRGIRITCGDYNAHYGG